MPAGVSRAGSSILPSGTYGTDLANVVRQLNQVAAASQGVFAALNAGIRSVESQVVSFVEKANPAAVQKFKFAVDDLTGVIGRALVPVLNNATTLFQKLADYFHALDPATKTLAAGLVAAAVGFTVVAVGVWTLNAAFATLTGGLSAILGAVGAMVAGILFASSGTAELKVALDAMLGPLSEVLNVLAEIVTTLVSALAPVVETVFGLIAAGLRVVADAVKAMLPTLLRMAAWFRAIAEFVAEVIGIQLGGAGGPAKAPAAVRPAQIGGLNEFLNRQMVNALGKTSPEQQGLVIGKGIAKDVQDIKRFLEQLLGAPKNAKVVAGVAARGLQDIAVGGALLAGQLMDRVLGKR